MNLVCVPMVELPGSGTIALWSSAPGRRRLVLALRRAGPALPRAPGMARNQPFTSQSHAGVSLSRRLTATRGEGGGTVSRLTY